MRRAKIGDVYYFKVPNGYKIVQWAYRDPATGDYLRVFEGLYSNIPENIDSIIAGPHDYIIGFFVSRAYQKGFAHFLGNYVVPSQYPFPEYSIDFYRNMEYEIFQIRIMPRKRKTISDVPEFFNVNSMDKLPGKYQELKMLDVGVSPEYLLFLFDYDFSLSNLRKFFPSVVLGDSWEAKFKEYSSIVEGNIG